MIAFHDVFPSRSSTRLARTWRIVVNRCSLELVVEANAPVVAQKKEDGASCRHFAATGWHHLPIELQSVVVSRNIARAPEDKTSRFHKLFVCGFDPLFKRFVPTNLA